MPVSFNGSYTQNFDTLANSGTGNAWTNDTTLSGWSLFRQPAPGTAIAAYDANNGGSLTGSFYSYGTTGSTDRALGGLGSGGTYFGSPATGAIAGWIGFAATNNTGTTLNNYTLSFNGEQWRNGGNATAQNMVLEYGFGSTFSAVSSWTTPGSTFDWTSPVATATAAAVNGNVAGRVSNRGGTITTPWANGATLWVRWVERNDTGNDHGLGIDDFSLTIPTISLTATDTTAAEGNINTGTFRLTRSSSSGTLAVQLSPASGIGTDYNLSAASGGTINASGTVFTFNAGVSTADITFTAIDDIPAEANETFALSLATDPTYTVDATNNTGSVTIQQNDFAVTNTNDSGEGSLRQAITNANAIAGTDTVTFNITGAGPHTISPTSALPNITQAVLIDGYTQTGASKNTLATGNNAQLKIVLDGTNAGSGVSGLTLGAGSNGSTIQGLTINRFQNQGIQIQSANNFVVGNFIGTDVTGTIDQGNNTQGIEVSAANNIIGGSNAADRNLISGNEQRGVLITGSSATGNTIVGNYIGTNAAGTGDIGNTLAGIILENNSSATIIRNNTISNNDRQGNTINAINANVQIFNSNNNTVAGNFIGTNSTGTGLPSAASNGGVRGIILQNASNNTIGGTTASDRNIISGNLHVGLEFIHNGNNNNRSFGNYIGTDVTGNNSIGNGNAGVQIYFAPNITIGGAGAGEGNLISGNQSNGINVLGNTATNSQIIGNYIGTNAVGTADLGNRVDGIQVQSGSNTITNNLISGNDRIGIYLAGSGATANQIRGNYIGTNASGNADLGNAFSGVYIDSASNNSIGTDANGINDAQERNIISGNDNDGITVVGSNNNIAGNYIGTDATGTLAIANADSGVWLNGSNNRVGTYVPGTNDAAKPNLLSGNAQSGVTFNGNTTTNNQVGGNFIGSDVTGNNPLPNNIAGVRIIGGANNNTLGGTTNQSLQSNIIAFNPVGVFANADTVNNSIVGNRIFSNTNLGIDLGNDGVTANDAGDGDTGANNLQNFPVLTYAEIAGSNTACAGTFNSTANTNFRLEFFANDVLDASGNGEGKTYLGFSNITTDASGNANFTITNLPLTPLGNFITATATNLTTNDTSEFSNGVIIDTPLVSITPASINQNEGNSGTTDYIFTATLSRATTQNVTLNYTTKDGTATVADNDYIDNDNSITFTAGGSLTQAITVKSNGDNIAESNETFTLNLDSATNAKINTTANIGTGTIINDDTASIIVTQNAGLTTTEAGGTATFTVKLTSQPTSNVTINLGSDNIQEGKTDKSFLTFTSANWNQDQTVTIIGQDDFIVDGNIAYNIITAKSTSTDTNYNNLDAADVPVINTDNDNAGITISQSGGSTNITEGGATDSYDIVLTSQPTSDVTIAINNSTQTVTTPTTVTFTSANWNTAQTVTVTATNDNVVEGNHSGTISHTATSSDANYNGIAISDVTANITDNDNAGITITQSGGNTNITEGGATDSYDIVLTSQPTSDVTIAINNSTQTVTTPTTVTFTSANWNTAQNITVTATNDNVVEGNHSGTISHTATSSDANYNGIAISDVTANITDNDNAGITITQSGGNTNITEGGATDSYDIVLTSQPTSDVTIAINNSTQTVTTPTTVTFTSANWNTAQNITVTATNDNVVEGNHSGTISHTATSSDANYNGVAISDVTANITDNDNAGITITQSGGNTNITEGGATDSYDIVLTSQPTSDVTIAINNSTQTVTTPTTVTFTSANWNTAQTVTVTATNDNVVEGNHSGTISHTATSSDANYNGIAISDVTANITDNDNAGFTITPTTLTTGETGTTANFTVQLNSQPTADVTLNLSSSNTTEGTIDKSDLTFTAGNWNTSQTVTITGKDDFIADGDKAYQIITAAATSTDSNYNNVNPVDINVTNTDNDNAGFIITPITLTTGENGTSANFTVKLNSQPTADVSFNLSSSNTTEGTIDKSSLIFTAGNWNTIQTVTISGKDDIVVDGDIAYQVITAAATSTDSNYNNVNPVDINVTNTDNDRANVSIIPATISQLEGNSGTIPYTFIVNLSNPSVVPVTVAYTTDNGSATAGSDYTDNDGTIAFNPGDTTKSITVNVLSDIIPETDETFTVSLVSASNATLNLSAKQSTGIIINDDTEEEDCFCSQIVYPNLNTLTGEGGPNRSLVLPNEVSSTTNGTVNNDTLTGSNISEALNGFEGDDLLLGNAGNDNLIGNAGNDTAFGGDGRDWISGNEGDDLLNGNLGDDVLNGNTGNDTVRGGQGHDFARGGGDNDLIWGDLGDDTLAGDKGNDTVFGGNSEGSDSLGRDLLFGGSGDDLLNGNAGNDTLFGDDGNDIVRGGKDDDIVVGNAGDDMLYGDKGNDSLCGSEGNDTIYGGNGNTDPNDANGDRDCICGGEGNDLLFGNENRDKIWGDEGDDTLRGGKDDDTLIGGAGNDLLIGDLGNDVLRGGSGSDLFALQNVLGVDTVIDFEDTKDLLGLASGLTFEQLAIAQINNATLISVKSSGQQLVTLSGVQANLIGQSDFVLLPLA